MTHLLKGFFVGSCVLFLFSTAQAETIGKLGDTNPFLPVSQPDPHIEPREVVSYSFTRQPNPITKLAPATLYLREARDTERQGYTRVAASKVRNFAEVIEQHHYHQEALRRELRRKMTLEPPRDIPKQLAFDRAELPFLSERGAAVLVDFPRGNYIPGRGWDAAIRIFESPEIGTLIISEWEYALSGGGVLMDADAVNNCVSGSPAILIVREDAQGNAETVLTWADAYRAYTLESDRNLGRGEGRRWLEKVATALSAP